MKKIPNRQVHLDFHTSEMIDQVGSKFSAEEFADTLKNANVEALLCLPDVIMEICIMIRQNIPRGYILI